MDPCARIEHSRNTHAAIQLSRLMTKLTISLKHSKTEEYCVTVNPTEQPSVSLAPSGSNLPSPSVTPMPSSPGAVVENCTYTTTINTTTRSFLQKNSKDVLSEMYSSFDDQCHNENGVELFSITYSGNACDFNKSLHGLTML